jgi:hypothetical protein
MAELQHCAVVFDILLLTELRIDLHMEGLTRAIIG